MAKGTSRFTAIATAGVTAAVISAAVNYSGIFGGDIVLDTTNNSTPAIVVDTSDAIVFTGTEPRFTGDIDFADSNSAACIEYDDEPFQCYQEITMTASGSHVLKGTIQSPYTTSSGTLIWVEVACGGVPTSMNMDIGTSTRAQGSGTNLFDNATFASSGSYKTATGTIVDLDGIAFDSSTYVHATTSTGGTTQYTNADCKLKVFSRARYGGS